ncbi:hypothetical protein JCM8097_005439 [Rhodosporidiobolus ruineniae]
MDRRALCLYVVLALVRTLVAFTSTGFIHPDEAFQSPDVAAGAVYVWGGDGDGPLKTWEWLGDSPCRSIVPVFTSTGFAFAVLKRLVGSSPSGRAFFLAQRAVMLLLSFRIDNLIWRTSRSSASLLLFASSPVTFTFLLRPFSNSLEAVALAALLLILSRLSITPNRWTLFQLGAVLAYGVFTRITFAAFATPLVCAAVFRLSQSVRWSSEKGSGLVSLVTLGAPAVLSFLLFCTLFATIDTLYFRGLPLRSLVLTPLNLLRYNLSADNLAEHGLHPRWLHAVVNTPVLFGAGLAVVWSAAKGRRPDEGKEGTVDGFRRKVYLAALVVPILLLSIQPHQEPRFLVPLVVPLVLLAPSASFLHAPSSSKLRRAFWTLWLLHSLLFTILFGHLHQGGLFPALLKLNDELRSPTSALGRAERVEVVFWKTFMPPRHLLIPPVAERGASHPSVSVLDLAGAPPASLVTVLSAPTTSSQAASPATSLRLLVAPACLVDPLALTCGVSSSAFADQVRLEPLFNGKTFGVHVDMDRLPELFAADGWSRTGVGVWRVERCEGEEKEE